ncbi:Ig-like domain-containing protein [Pseudomonas chlororaphis]|uniref:Ig-like domain-containing protein n=1 Tax=Pseudomonas chlororaphis TaxID=587753 RepID=UPI0025B056E7|nr:Ig-like domain-containing protein [Pseudomonas chlororaphis]WJV27648.1 Ig-like domain-containing protein [Pseudomonas chlororaphis]
MDDRAPFVGLIANGTTTNDSTPTLSGGGEPGSIISVFDNGKFIGSTTVSGTGHWSFTPVVPLGEGAHRLTVTATDAAGNQSAPSGPLSFTVDTSVPATPAAPASYADDVGAIQDPASTAATTDDTTPGINIGTVPTGTTPSLYVDGTRVEAIYDPATGTLTPVTPLGEGAHQISYTLTNEAGSESAPSGPLSFTVDTSVPATPAAPASYADDVGAIQDPASTAATTDDTTPGINIGTVPTGTTPSLYVDGTRVEAIYDPATGTLTPVTPLGEGAHQISYTLTNEAGSESAPSGPLSFTVDTSVPATPAAPASYADDVGAIQDPASTAATTDDTTPGINIGTVPTGTTPSLYVDGTRVEAIYDPATGTLTPVTPLGEGAHQISYTLTNEAGSESAPSGPLSFTVDTSVPTTPAAPASYADDVGAIQDPASTAATTDDTTPGINIGTVPTGTTPSLYVDGTRVEAIYDPATGTLTPVTPLGEGAHQISYTLTNEAGSESAPSGPLSFTVDTSVPTTPAAPASYADDVGAVQDPASTAATTDDTTPGINIGTVPTGTTPSLYVDGTRVEAIYDPATGTLTPVTPLGEGAHQISYTLTNEAGSESAPSGPLSFTVDTSVPATPAAPASYADDVGAIQDPASTAATTDDTTPGINIGTVPTGTTPSLYVDGTRVEAIYDPATGTLTPVTPLGEGAHQISYTLTNEAGSESAPSGPLSFTVDTSVPATPAAPASYADDVGAIQDPASTAATTDDTTPGINIGTVPTGTTPSLYVDGTRVEAIYDPATGTLTPVTPLGEGAHQISYTLTNEAGSESAPSGPLSFTVDTSVPATPAAPASYADDVGAIQDPASTAATTDDTTPGINIGTVPTGTTPSLYVDGTRVEAIYDPATGTLTPVTPLGEGAHQISYTLTNEAGSESAPSGPLSFTVDTSVPATPAAPASYADDVGAIQDPASTAATTDDTTPGINIGTVPTGTTPSLYVDGTRVEAIYDPATGTLTPVTPLGEGAHQISYTLTNEAGSESAPSGPLSFTVDTSVPATPAAPASYADDVGAIQDPASTAATTDDTTPGINIGTVPTGTTPSLYVDGTRVEAIYDPATGTLTPVTPLGEGAHQISYTLTNEAGSESAPSGPLSFTVDTSVPTTPAAPASYADDVGAIQDPASTAATTDDTTPGINIGTVPTGTTPSLYVDGTRVEAIYDPATGTLTPVTPLGEGAHQISYTLTNEAGSESAPSGPLSFTVDTSVPTTPAAPASYADDVGAVQDPASTAATTDDTTPGINIGTVPTGTTPSLYVDGTRVEAIYDPATGTLTPVTPLGEGAHQISYTLTNEAGSESAPSGPLSFTVDTSVPATPAAPASYADDVGAIQDPASTAATTDDTTPGINIGTVPTGTTPSLYVDGTRVEAIYDPATGTLTPVTPLGEGAHQISYTLTNEAGSESAPSGPLSFTVDTSVPATPAAPASYADDVGAIQDPASTAATTDDTTPGINIGTVPTGTTPSLYVDGTRVEAIYDPATGTLTPVTPLGEGAHQISYTLTNEAGSESAPSGPLSFTVDTSVPATPAAPASYADDVGAIQDPASTAATTDDTTPGINIGTVPTGTTPSLYVDGTRVEAIYDPATGTLTPVTPLGEGAHQISYTLTNEAGSESAPSGPLSFTVDTSVPTTPAAPASYADDVGAIQDPASTAATTDDTTPGINIGTVPTGTTPSLYVDGTRVEAIYDPATGTLTPVTPLGEGAHQISYTLTNEAGSESAPSGPLSFTVDTSVPTTPAAPASYADDVGAVQDPASTAATTDDTTPGINIGTVPTGTTPSLYVDGTRVEAIYDPATGTLTPVTPLGEGAHQISYTLTNEAGSESAPSGPLSFTVDTSVPATPAAPASYADDVGAIQDPASTAATTDDTTPGINIGTVPTGTTPSLYVDGTRVEAIYDPATGTLTPVTPLGEGAHQISYTLTNEAGSESAPSGPLSFTVDTSVPATPAAPASYADDVGAIQDPASTAATTDDTTPGINIGTVPTGTTPSLYVDGTRVEAIYDPATGTLTPVTPLGEGAHQISYTLTNEAGSESAPSGPLSFTVDTSVPATPAAPASYADDVGAIQDPASTAATTDDTTPGINIGTVPTGTTPSLYVDGTRVEAIYDPATGTLTPVTPLGEGAHQISYTLTNEAGSESAPSGPLSFTVDTSVPATPAAPASYADDVGAIQDPASTAATTDDTTPGINIGTVPTGTTPSLYVDGTRVEAIYDPATGTLTPVTPLGEGAHQISYTLTNEAGSESAPSGPLSFTVDTSVPATPAAPASYADDVGAIQDPASTAATTDDTTPGINIGTVPTGTTPSLYVDGTRVEAIYDPATGTLTPVTPLGEGAHQISYTLTNEAGSESAPSGPLSFTVDTSVPTTPAAPASYADDVGAIQDPASTAATTDDTTPGINIGTVPTGTTPSLYVDGTRVEAIYDPATGTLTPVTPLGEGAHQISYTLTNEAGSESAPSGPLSFTVDTSVPTTPAAPASYADDVGAVQDPASTAATTDDTTPGINIGTVPTGTTPSLYVDGTRVEAIYDPATGTLTPVTPLGEGAHQISYTLTNEAGSESAPSGPLSFTVDTSVPATPAAPASYADDVGAIQDPASTAATTDDTTPGINIGTVPTGTTPSLYVDGTRVEAIYDPATGTLTPVTPLGEGAHQISYTLTNEAGSESAPSGPLSFTVDTSVPATPAAPASYADDVGAIQDPASTAATTDDTTPGINIGTVPTGTTPSLYVDGTRVEAIYDPATGTLTPVTPLGEGAHQISYTLTNEAGSESAPSGPLSFTIDTTPPTQGVSIDGYIDNAGPTQGTFGSGTTTDDRNPILTGTLTAPLDVSEVVHIYEGTTLLGTATVDGTGTSWTFDPGNLADGSTHTYTAVVADLAGNQGTPSNNFTLTSDYTVTVNSQVTVDTTPLVTGAMPFKLANGEYIEVSIAGTTYSSANGAVVVDPLNNTWYVQVPSEIALGTYNVTAIIKSGAGAQIVSDDTVNELIISAAPTVTVGSAASDPNQKATAYTLSETGMWRIHSNQTMLNANGTDNATLGSFSQTALYSNSNLSSDPGYSPTGYTGRNFVQNATFIDFNRDGYMDLFAEDSTYDDGQQAFIFNGSTYVAQQVGAYPTAPTGGDRGTADSANTYSWFGGVIGFDRAGNGLVDLAYGDQTPNDATSGGGFDSQIVLNTDGTILGMVKDGAYVDTATVLPLSSNSGNATFDMELSGVDLNNDGKVDLVYHATAGSTKLGGALAVLPPTSSNQHRLVVATNQGDGTWSNTQIINNTFQRLDDDPNFGNGISMTWADFNGDGYMDLFIGRGYGAAGVLSNSSYESRILFNNGSGQLSSTAPTGIGLNTGTYTFGDTLQGGPSVAVDWNGDGKMDVIELPGFGDTGGMTAAGNTGPVNLYTNTSSGGTTSFTTTNLLGGSNTIGRWLGAANVNTDAVTGGIAADIDWDGDRDLLVFTQKGNTRFIANTNTVADGTVLHFRIVDAQGINSLYGHTVQLFDSSNNLVSTQIINAQSGNQTNDSSAIVDFYGLNPNETYSLVLLRSANGDGADVGGLATLGGNVIENVNAAWTGLKAGEANKAYVLTAESGTNVANANIGHGIVGTGYNDTFFATLGNDKYEGGGGTVTVSGTKVWSSTAGIDIVDYKLAGSTSLTIDLSVTTAQNTGFGTATFSNIEGIAGGSGADTFTDNASDNVFEGRGGNDTFNLINGGKDTLLYKLVANDAVGGNGSDVVNGFTIGTYEATPNADRIDVSKLLVGYTADADGPAHYINGVATIDAGDTIGNYLSVTNSGGNTIISIDRDGTGSTFSATPIVTLNNVTTDLETLLANHQVVV